MKKTFLFAVTAVILGLTSCSECLECTNCSSERTVCRSSYATAQEYEEAIDAAEFSGCECSASSI